MAKIIFIYGQNNYEMKFNNKNNISINSILYEYVRVLSENINELLFLYKGKNLVLFGKNLINLNFSQNLIIMVFKRKKNISNNDVNDIICPECENLGFLNIRDDKNFTIDCTNNHKYTYSSMNEFMNSQNIDKSKYICEICQNNKKLYNDNNYYFCSCGKYICQLCIKKHSEDHLLIEYRKRYTNCNKHYMEFLSYCSLCNCNLCEKCEEEHSNHKNKIIIYKKEKPEKNKLIEMKSKINEIIDKLREFQKHINILQIFFEHSLNDINKDINQYIKFYEKIFISLNELKNYQSIKNILNIKKDNIKNKINIFCDEDIKNKMKYLVDNYINYKIEMTIVYKINENDNEIRLFGQKFIENNKLKFQNLIINNKKKELFEFYKLNEKEKKMKSITIKIVFKDIITDMSYMFSNCSNLSSLPDLSKWITNNVTNMSYMFYNCSKLSLIPDLSELNTNNVTDMSYMFYNCSNLSSLPDLSKWNVNNVTNMSFMFYKCSKLSSLPDISKWNIDNVNNLSYMFYECSNLSLLPDISKWNTNEVTN